MDTATQSHVYLLVDRGGQRFKIGKANDVISRAKCLGLGIFDLDRSVGLMLPSEAHAFDMENALRRSFTRWRMTRAEVLEQGGPADGATEWMRVECLDRVLRFVEENGDIFQSTRLADLHSLVQKPKQGGGQAGAERQRPKAQTARERKALQRDQEVRKACLGINDKAVGAFLERVATLKASGALVLMEGGLSCEGLYLVLMGSEADDVAEELTAPLGAMVLRSIYNRAVRISNGALSSDSLGVAEVGLAHWLWDGDPEAVDIELPGAKRLMDELGRIKEETTAGELIRATLARLDLHKAYTDWSAGGDDEQR